MTKPKPKNNTMKAFALCAKATLLVATLFAVNPSRRRASHWVKSSLPAATFKLALLLVLTDWATPTSITTILFLVLQCKPLVADPMTKPTPKDKHLHPCQSL